MEEEVGRRDRMSWVGRWGGTRVCEGVAKSWSYRNTAKEGGGGDMKWEVDVSISSPGQPMSSQLHFLRWKIALSNNPSEKEGEVHPLPGQEDGSRKEPIVQLSSFKKIISRDLFPHP